MISHRYMSAKIKNSQLISTLCNKQMIQYTETKSRGICCNINAIFKFKQVNSACSNSLVVTKLRGSHRNSACTKGFMKVRKKERNQYNDVSQCSEAARNNQATVCNTGKVIYENDFYFFFTMKFLKIPDHAGNTGCQWFIISRKMENTLILYM